MLVVLFGLAGSGKSYVGNLLGERSNFYFWDADEALTDDINACIREKRSISQDMRDSYFNIVMNRIELLCSKHENVVIAQAFYKNKNREQVLSRFPGSLFLQVTSNFEILLNRLRKRNNDVDGDYALKISSDFESPTHKYYILMNVSEGDPSFLMQQFMDVPVLRVALLNETGFGLKNRSGLDRFSVLFDSIQAKSEGLFLDDLRRPRVSDGVGLKNFSGNLRFWSSEKMHYYNPSIPENQSLSSF